MAVEITSQKWPIEANFYPFQVTTLGKRMQLVVEPSLKEKVWNMIKNTLRTQCAVNGNFSKIATALNQSYTIISAEEDTAYHHQKI